MLLREDLLSGNSVQFYLPTISLDIPWTQLPHIEKCRSSLLLYSATDAFENLASLVDWWKVSNCYIFVVELVGSRTYEKPIFTSRDKG